MSDKQVAVVESGNRQEESESTQETTLTEISKNSGQTKSLEKKAEFEEHNKESIVEDHRTQSSQSSKQVTQSEYKEVSENRQESSDNFEPLKPFMPIQPFEPPKSFELAKKLESERRKNEGTLPDNYKPVEILAPIDLDSLETESDSREIKEEKIKNSLKEIISDLDSYVEKDEKSETLTVNSKETISTKDENTPPKPPVDLDKIFTPADGEQIKPASNRKMFASSAFYAKGLHPTVEEQVELAKRISSSLSDISNVSSKGQSMYVNRKKRSVKWVHEGEGEKLNGSEFGNNYGNVEKKSPLTLVMNPHGKVQDINTLKKQGYSFESALSPDVCLEIVKDLNSPKGKGAELFAKRRKRSEKWVVGENTAPATPQPILSISPSVNYPQPSFLPETAQRVQHKEKLDEIQAKIVRPKVKLIRSPWDAALETGSVDAAFENLQSSHLSKGNFVSPCVESYENALKSDKLASWTGPKYHENHGHHQENAKIFAHNPAYNSSSINRIVDNLQRGVSNVDVYKPALPTAWSQRNQQQQNYSSISSNSEQPTSYDNESANQHFLQPDIPGFRSVSPTPLIQPSPAPSPPTVRENQPFSLIPNTEIDDKVVRDDIQKFQLGETLESRVRPRSPFPNIPDIKLNPEIIEKDIVSLRTSPIALNRNYQTENIENCSFYKTENRNFESVCMEKNYELKDAGYPEIHLPEPEFEYAIINPEFKVVENVFTPSTAANVHTISSENFERKGHFVARDSTSPFPVFVPKPPELPETPITEEKPMKIMVQIREKEPEKDPMIEEHIKHLVTSGKDQNIYGIQGQKMCFSELHSKGKNQQAVQHDENEIKKILNGMKQAWEAQPKIEPTAQENPQNLIATHQGSNENTSIQEMKEENRNSCSNELYQEKNEKVKNEKSVKFQEETQSFNNQFEPQNLMGVCNEIIDEITEKAAIVKEKITTATAPKPTEKKYEPMMFEEVPKPLCKKAPETIIGARPLFGRLDINSEFKKAITGRQKSLQNKRNREIYKASQMSVPKPEPKTVVIEAKPCGNFQTSIIKRNEDFNENSALKSQFRKDEIVKIEDNPDEEFEKIYYQRERSLSIDLQVIGDQIQQNDIKNIIDQEMSKYNIKIPSNITHNNSIDDGYEQATATARFQTIPNFDPTQKILKENSSSTVLVRPEPIKFPKTASVNDVSELFENYEKIPVKSLIENFEQNSMPTLKIKEYNLPKQSSYNENFENYYVANAKVQTRYETYTSNNNQTFQISSNSSFSKYTPTPPQISSTSRRSSLSSSSSSSSGTTYYTSAFNQQQQELYNYNYDQDLGKTVSVQAPIAPPLSPSKFKPTTPTPQQVFIPKESNSPLPNYYLPSYNATPNIVVEHPIIIEHQDQQYNYNQKKENAVCKKIDFGSLHNYNTAPRGWNQNKNVYKPITFDKQQYTDF